MPIPVPRYSRAWRILPATPSTPTRVLNPGFLIYVAYYDVASHKC
jgi:hypothetical protein